MNISCIVSNDVIDG